jgi:GntR family transcriptional regulator
VQVAGDAPRASRPIRSAPLAQQVAEILHSWMQTGEVAAGDQLPAEHDLASRLDVSRATIRTALDTLVERGLVVRRQGIGNFVSEASRIANHLADAEDFVRLIERSGAQAGIDFVEVGVRDPDPHVAGALGLDADAPVLWAAKVFTADRRPVIYCINSIPVSLLGADVAACAARRPEITEPLFDFLESHGHRTAFQLSAIAAVSSDAVTFPGRALPAATALLAFDETGYTADNQRIWHSRSWYPPSEMRFELVRRRARSKVTAA